MNDSKIKPVELLFIERNPGNLKKFIEVFNESEFPNHIRFTGSADAALRMIFLLGEYSNVPKPDIIIADVDTYHSGGVGVFNEVLDNIAKNEDINCIPTVILTSLEDKEEEFELYNCPNLLVPKPVKFEDYRNIAESIIKFSIKSSQK